MRTGIVVEVGAADRARLEAVAADRNSPQKHVWRVQIVLLTADGCCTTEIMCRTGKAKTAVWRWQERFMPGRRGRPAARQDPARPCFAFGAAGRGVRGGADPGGTCWATDYPLDGRRHGPC